MYCVSVTINLSRIKSQSTQKILRIDFPKISIWNFCMRNLTYNYVLNSIEYIGRYRIFVSVFFSFNKINFYWCCKLSFYLFRSLFHKFNILNPQISEFFAVSKKMPDKPFPDLKSF